MDTTTLVAVAREVREFAKAGLRDDSSRRRLRLLERSPLLRGLTPVQVAGGDSKAQYEYLIQAVVDAVDEIGRTVSPLTLVSSAPLISEGAREARALRALFGLTTQTRIRTWRARQEAAASELTMSWDHFRHNVQEELLLSVSEHILNASTGNRRHSSGAFGPTAGLSAFATQKDIENATVEYIREVKPPTAAMLEFSTATTGSILRALRDVNANISLLAANPEKISGWHADRMRRSLVDLMRIDFGKYSQLRLRLYSVPPSLRGRSFGGLIIVGWYTHRDNKRVGAFDPAHVEVWGHDNAIVVGRSAEDDGAVLSTWFSREFDRLWLHRATLDEATSAGILGMPD